MSRLFLHPGGWHSSVYDRGQYELLSPLGREPHDRKFAQEGIVVI